MNALIATPTLKDAAFSSGVSVKTLQRWLDDPGFVNQVKAAQDEILEGTTRIVAAAASRAVATLQGIMEDAGNPSGARVSAARTLLDTSMRIFELQNIQRRLEAIERALNL